MLRIFIISCFGFVLLINAQTDPSSIKDFNKQDVITDTVHFEPSSSGASWKVSQREISNLPFRGVRNILSLYPEFVIQDREAHLRGSRAGEMGYYLGGMSVRDPVSGALQNWLIDEAIEKVYLDPGYFDVRHGNAVAGIIRQAMRTGGKDFSIRAQYRGEPVKSGTDMGGSYANGYQNLVFEAGGPLYFENLRFFFVHEYQYVEDATPRFYSPFAYYDQVYHKEYLYGPEGTTDLIWDGRLTPRNQMEQNRSNASLQFSSDRFRAKITAALIRKKQHVNDSPIFALLNDRGGYILKNGILWNSSLHYKVNDKIEAFLQAGYSRKEEENFDDIFGNRYQYWYDVEENAKQGIEFFNAIHSFWEFGGFLFEPPGYPPFERYFKTKSESYSLSASTSVKTFDHFSFIIGMDYQKYILRRYSLNTEYYKDIMDHSGEDIDYYLRQLAVDNWGYDFYGAESDSGFNRPKMPVFGAAFFNVNYKLNQIDLNAGLRVEYLDGDNRAFKNPKNPYLVNGIISPKTYYDADPEIKLSPRISVSLPASDHIRVFTNYGIYYQIGRGSERYYGNNYISYQLAGGFYNRKPFGFDLKPVKSKNFEAGFTGMVFNIIHFKVSMFHRRVENQSAIDHMKTDSLSAIPSYEFLSNRVHSQTDGTNISVHFQPAGEISFGGDYSYTNARGLYSYAYDGIAPVTQKTMFPNLMSPLSYARKHRGTLYFNFYIPENQGKILSGTGVGLVYRFSSGHPYTKIKQFFWCYGNSYQSSVGFESDGRSKKPIIPINGATTELQKLMNLRLKKDFTLSNSFRVTLFLDVENLFNEKFSENVYAFSGSSTGDKTLPSTYNSLESFFARFGPGVYYDYYRNFNLRNGGTYLKFMQKELWNTPRQFRLGIELSY